MSVRDNVPQHTGHVIIVSLSLTFGAQLGVPLMCAALLCS